MNDATFFKTLTDNNITCDLRFMVYFNGYNNPSLTFKGMQIMIILSLPYLYYNLKDGVYQSVTSDIDEIKLIWNTEVKVCIKKTNNLELLQRKI